MLTILEKDEWRKVEVKGLNISVNQLLSKMESELIEARASRDGAQMREKVYAIKSLCDLILETPLSSTMKTNDTTSNVQLAARPLATNDNQLQVDEANGDSIFDF